ncbi:MAG: hypothetical protein RBU21_12230, partial [FCB group bacterium]|nr:hypothetical protein [FCB group bacterium]
MARKNAHTAVKNPKLCYHSTGRFYVRIKGKSYYLGKDESRAQQRYHALLAQLAATGLAVPIEKQPSDITVGECLGLYLEHARNYYGKGGKTASQVGRIKAVVLCAMDLYGAELASDFGPLRLRAVQAELVTRGYCRTNINSMCGCLKLAYKWLASHELVPASVAVALSVVPGLRKGKTDARESDPVLPVLETHIEAVRAVLPQTLLAMVDLQLACGARPGEILELRPCDVDRTGPVWIATLNKHKTAHQGKPRTLYFGPKAQAVLRPFLLNRGPADYLFNP